MRKILISVVLLFVAAHAADPDVRAIFEKARIMAEKNQNLTEAIRLFGQVVSLAHSERALAARAQYQQGLLYERLGRREEALSAFRAVLSGFADQADVVALARVKLPPVPAEMRTRVVWKSDDVIGAGGASPDGRLLSWVDRRTGDLMVHDLETAADRRLVRNTASNFPSGAASSVFSRDGKWVVYSWNPGGPGQPMEVRMIAPDGSGQQTIYHESGPNPVRVDDCDGKYVLARAGAQERLISLSGGSSSILELSPNWRGDRVRLSPDGRFAAYTALSGTDRPVIETRVFAIGTAADLPLLANAHNDVVSDWSSDGAKLVFASLRGDPAIWAVSMANGRSQGEPQVLTANPGGMSATLGLTPQGALVYAVMGSSRDVFLSEFDPSSEKLSTPKVLSDQFVGNKSSPVWSPEGTTLAFLGKNVLRVRNMATGAQRPVPSLLQPIDRILEWHPTGLSVFVQGMDKSSKPGTFRVDLESGEATFVVPVYDEREAFSHDANTVYMWAGKDEPKDIISQNLLTGEKKVLYSRPVSSEVADPNLSLSPDGKILALQLMGVPQGFNSLAVMPVTGGEPRILLQLRLPEHFGRNSFAWSADMRYVFASRVGRDHSEIWKIPADGGAGQAALTSMPGIIRQLRVSPNGCQFAFVSDQSSNEVWVLENALPKAPPSQPAKK